MQSPARKLSPASVEPTPLAKILTERIRAHRPITFAEYMEACLYHPVHGYYAKANQTPRRDYFTSVDAGPIFGRLLARQFDEMWRKMDRAGTFWLVEAGAGTGALAKVILDSAAAEMGEFYEALQYVCVERSEVRRAAQARNLTVHATRGRATSCAQLPEEILMGCIFSNELLDALPVHRVIQEKGKLREIFVAATDEGFREETGELSDIALREYFAVQGIELSDEQQAEVSLDACRWIEDAGKRLGRGFVVTIDYGHEAQELYDERHMRGTMLAYERHRASEEFCRAPGEQDLTAHVNFTALDLWGRRQGLTRTGLTSQTNFLLALARHSEFADLQSSEMSEAEQARARLLFKTLIHPEGMGETFQVFVQQKGVERVQLAGFEAL